MHDLDLEDLVYVCHWSALCFEIWGLLFLFFKIWWLGYFLWWSQWWTTKWLMQMGSSSSDKGRTELITEDGHGAEWEFTGTSPEKEELQEFQGKGTRDPPRGQFHQKDQPRACVCDTAHTQTRACTHTRRGEKEQKRDFFFIWRSLIGGDFRSYFSRYHRRGIDGEENGIRA